MTNTNCQLPNAIDITFKSHECLLKGKFYAVKDRGLFPTAIMLHGFPGNENDVLGLGQKMCEARINTLTFNYSGTHQSEGEFSLENTLRDILTAYQYLHLPEIISSFNIDPMRICLGGASYGGGMALAFAANHPEINSVFSIAGTDHGELAREYSRNPSFAQMMDSIFDELKAPLGPIKFGGKEAFKELMDNADRYDLRSSALKLADRNILLLGGWEDLNVTIEDHLYPYIARYEKREPEIFGLWFIKQIIPSRMSEMN